MQNGRRIEVGPARASQESGFSDLPQRVEGLQTTGRSNSFQPFLWMLYSSLASQVASGKESTCQCWRHKRHRLDPRWGRAPGGGYGNALQYSCLENPMDREIWRATVHGVTKSPTWQSDYHTQSVDKIQLWFVQRRLRVLKGGWGNGAGSERGPSRARKMKNYKDQEGGVGPDETHLVC